MACQVDQRGNWVLLRRAFDAAAGGLQSSDPAIWPGPTIWSRQGTDIAHREHAEYNIFLSHKQLLYAVTGGERPKVIF
jgi:hypothetical protein